MTVIHDQRHYGVFFPYCNSCQQPFCGFVNDFFVLMLYVLVNNFQSCRDDYLSSGKTENHHDKTEKLFTRTLWVEPVLST